MNWKLVKQIWDKAGGEVCGGVGWGIDLISCARQPVEGRRFSRF